MHKIIHWLAATCLTVLSLSGCGLLAVQEQHEKIAQYCQLSGTVNPELDDHKRLVIALFKYQGGDINDRKNWGVFDHFVTDQPGKWQFQTTPGQYALGAFKDVNGDLIYQLDEPALAPSPQKIIDCQANAIQSAIGLIIPEQGRSQAQAPLDIAKLQIRSARQQQEISLGQIVHVGELAKLDEPRFADEVANASLWRPLDFMIDGHAGLYFLEPYSPQKLPVLFVHGINGTPRNFNYLIEHLDRSRYQPWVLYYPSGASIDNIARHGHQVLQKLQARYGFKQIAVIAHSMGGLVSRKLIFNILDSSNTLNISLFVSISTPWNGHNAAKLGVDHAPTPVYSWEDLAPDSRFLKDLFYSNGQRRQLPQTMSKHLLFSFINSEAGDGTVSLESQLRPEAQAEADKLYGYNENHMDILNSAETLETLNKLLKGIH